MLFYTTRFDAVIRLLLVQLIGTMLDFSRWPFKRVQIRPKMLGADVPVVGSYPLQVNSD